MAAQRRPTEHRRVEIAEAALHLIATRGIAELTTRQVAEAVGVTTGALFRHFASLDEILCAVADRVEEILRGTYPPEGLGPVEQLERFVDARASTVGKNVGILRLVMSEQFALALPQEAATKLQQAVKETRAFVGKAISEGQKLGEIRSDVAPEILTTVVVGTIQVAAFDAARGAQGPAGRSTEVRAGLLRLLAAPAITRGASR